MSGQHRGRHLGHRVLTTLVAVAVTLALSAPTSTARAADRGHQHAQRDKYAQLAVQWWERAVETPTAENPFGQGTCESAQSGRTWFLVGTFVGNPDRTCTVPRGTRLFIPLVNNLYGAFLSDPAEQRTADYVLGQAECVATAISVSLDGHRLNRRLVHHVSASDSGLFDLQLPEDNVLGLTESDVPQLRFSPSAQSGDYLLLRPLRPGTHRLHWIASNSCGNDQDVTYTIVVTRHRS